MLCYWFSSFLQIAASDIVYLFDAFNIGHDCITFGLDQIFSSSTILKVTISRYVCNTSSNYYSFGFPTPCLSLIL